MDISFDRLPENPDDPLRALNEIISTQDELIKRGLAILEKVRIEIKSRKEVSEADERLKEVPCRDDIAQM